MGFDSPVHWLIVILVIALLFGGSRVGNLMGELGKGIKAFKSNLNEAGEPETGKSETTSAKPGSTGSEAASARIATDASAPASGASGSEASHAGTSHAGTSHAGASQATPAREPAPAGEESAGHGDRR